MAVEEAGSEQADRSHSPKGVAPSANLFSSSVAFQGPGRLESVYVARVVLPLESHPGSLNRRKPHLNSPAYVLQALACLLASAAAWLRFGGWVRAGAVCGEKVDTLSCCCPRIHFFTPHSVFLISLCIPVPLPQSFHYHRIKVKFAPW